MACVFYRSTLPATELLINDSSDNKQKHEAGQFDDATPTAKSESKKQKEEIGQGDGPAVAASSGN